MKQFKVTIEKTISNDQIAGIISTGIEGGMMNCWASVAKQTKPKKAAEFKDDWLDYPCYSYPLGEGGSVTFEDTYTGKRHVLNRASIARGLKAMAEKHPGHFNDFLTQNDDASTGDIFVQCCLFGKAIYG